MFYENDEELRSTRADDRWIPESCNSFFDMSLYLAESAEEEYNKLFESVGIEELAVYESTGMEVVYEEGKLKEFKDKVVNFFRGIWEKIKAAYQKVLDWFDKKREEMYSKINVKVLNKSVVDNIPATKKMGKVHTFNMSVADNFITNAKNMVTTITTEMNKLSDSTNEAITEKKNELAEQLVSSISGISDAKAIKDIKKPLKEKMISSDTVDVDKEWLSKNWKEVSGIVIAGSTKRDIKKSYQDEKTNIDKNISEVKKMKEGNMSVASAKVALYKNVVQTLNVCSNVKIDACRTRYNEYRIIFMRVAGFGIKVKGGKSSDSSTESTNESYYTSQTYDTNLVNSIFNW